LAGTLTLRALGRSLRREVCGGNVEATLPRGASGISNSLAFVADTVRLPVQVGQSARRPGRAPACRPLPQTVGALLRAVAVAAPAVRPVATLKALDLPPDHPARSPRPITPPAHPVRSPRPRTPSDDPAH